MSKVGGVHVQRGNQQRRVKVLGRDGEVKGEVPHHALVEALVEREGIATSLTPDALVEEELRAVTVCEECRELPLGASTTSLNRRRHLPRPWRCKPCATRASFRAAVAALTWEQRSAMSKKRVEGQSAERRSDILRRANAARTPSERSETARRRAMRVPPGERGAALRQANARRTPAERSESAKRGKEAMTAKQRSEAVRKAWIKRRANTTRGDDGER